MGQAKKVLITGGAGFIGANLARTLLAEGNHVDCVDNLITGRLEAIQPFRSMESFRFLKLDVADPAFLNAAVCTHYDEIYHLACPTGVPNIKILGEEMIRTCSSGTEQVLKVASVHNATLIYASSAEVYGDPEVSPQAEAYCGNVDPIGPRSAYEEGKRFGESLVRLYAEKYCVDAKIVRIFNTYGTGMRRDDSRLIPRFLGRIREGKSVIVYGDGTQTRSHLHIADLIAGLRIVISQGERGEVYNLGGAEPLSILGLVELISELTPAPVRVEHRRHFIADHAGRRPGTEKARSLGWAPTVDLRHGLREMLASYGIPAHQAVTDAHGRVESTATDDHAAVQTDAP